MADLLAYASPTTPRPKPTRHSAFVVLSWLVYIGGVAFDKTIVALAYRGSRTYPWERFERNVGSLWLFQKIEWRIAVGGAILALIALLIPFRKRWAAWLALCSSVLSMMGKLYQDSDAICLGIVMIASLSIAMYQIILWYMSKRTPKYAVQID